MKLLGVSSNVIDQTWIEAYSSPFPDYESAIGAYEFPIGAYLGRIGEYVLEGLQGVEDLTSNRQYF